MLLEYQLFQESISPYPVTNIVAINRVLEQEQAGGVVDGQRPEDLGRQGQWESNGVVLAAGCIQSLAI